MMAMYKIAEIRWTLLACTMLLALFVGACKKEDQVQEPEELLPVPVAAFSMQQVSADDPFTFRFENESENFNRVDWRFGDDSTSVEESPTHTFLGPGRFRVTAYVENEQGYWAESEQFVTIRVDTSIVISSRALGAGGLELGLNTDVELSEFAWLLKSGGDTLRLISQERVFTFQPENEFEEIVLIAQTPKGSNVSLERLISPFGVLQNITRPSSLSVLRDNDGGPNAGEGSLKLIDGNFSSKFLLFNYTGEMWAMLDLYEPVSAGAYRITSANDAPERDPKNWQLEGSNDAEAWTILDTRTDQVFEQRFQTKAYAFNNSESYRYYRLVVTANQNSSLLQIGEWELYRTPQ